MIKSRKIWFLNKRKSSEKPFRSNLGYKVVKNYTLRTSTYPPDKILILTRVTTQLCHDWARCKISASHTPAT